MDADADLAAASEAMANAEGVVVVRPCGARLRVGPAERFFFDSAHGHVIVQRRSSFIALPVGAGARRAAPRARGIVVVGTAPAVLARLSLDGSLLAVQTSPYEVVVAEADGARRWRIEVRGGGGGATAFARDVLDRALGVGLDGDGERAAILGDGLAWSDHGGTSQDLVVATTRGAELYKASVARGRCSLVRALPHRHARWHRWSHAHRLLVLATGEAGRDIRPYFLRRDVGDLPRFELPPPERARTLRLSGAESLDLESVDLATVRGAPTLVVRARGRLDLYRVGRDACEALAAITLPFEGPVSVTVRDDLLCAHARGARESAAFDVGAGAPAGPVAPPAAVTGAAADAVYGGGAWARAGADAFIDGATGDVVDVDVDVAAVALAGDGAAATVAFLLRRGADPDPARRTAPSVAGGAARRTAAAAATCALVLSGLVAEGRRADLARCLALVAATDAGAAGGDRGANGEVVLEVADAPAPGAGAPPFERPRARGGAWCAVPQADVLRRVLARSPAPAADVLDAAVLYVRALLAAGRRASPALAALVVRAALDARAFGDLVQLLQYRALGDSFAAAEAALASPLAAAGPGAAVAQLAYDMLHRLGAAPALARRLLRAGLSDEALPLCAALDADARPRPHDLLHGAFKAAAKRPPGDRAPPILAALRAADAWYPRAPRPPIPRGLLDARETAVLAAAGYPPPPPEPAV